jgi:small-conductance mechanosensitive channel
MSAKDLTLDLVIRYGFQLLGAAVILGVGFVLARWIGNLTNRWLDKRVKERFRASEIEIPFPQHEVRLLNHS